MAPSPGLSTRKGIAVQVTSHQMLIPLRLALPGRRNRLVRNPSLGKLERSTIAPSLCGAHPCQSCSGKIKVRALRLPQASKKFDTGSCHNIDLP
jgi:hypothetical protein